MYAYYSAINMLNFAFIWKISMSAILIDNFLV